jgi:hypothetical protein
MSSRRIVLAITGFYAVGVIGGVLSALNVVRLAEKHVDRGEEMTRWSIMQFVVGHFFVQYGHFVFILSSFIVLGLWVAVGVRGAVRHRSPDRGND